MSKGYVAAWPKGREASKHPALIKSLKTGVAGGGGQEENQSIGNRHRTGRSPRR